jgi:dihydroorotate dehydrogenase electron transfer subunit
MLTPQRITAPVIHQHLVAPTYYRLRFRSEVIATTAHPGQFVHVLPRSNTTCDPLLRRAFSILSVQNQTFDILYKTIGKGTTQMSRWRPGDTADIIGPLGHPFRLPRTPNCTVFLVGGGVGVPPLAMLAEKLSSGKQKVAQVTALLGARSRKDVLCRDDFERSNARVKVTTEDGSEGHHGLVTDLLVKHLSSPRDQSHIHVYACGPLPMLRAVAMLCIQRDIPCQISLEENMPCGIGICNGCVIPVVGSGDEYGRYRRICVEGPVVQARDIDWMSGDGQPCA